MKKVVSLALSALLALSLAACSSSNTTSTAASSAATSDAASSEESTSDSSSCSGKDSLSFMWGRNCHTLLSVAKLVY